MFTALCQRPSVKASSLRAGDGGSLLSLNMGILVVALPGMWHYGVRTRTVGPVSVYYGRDSRFGLVLLYQCDNRYH